MAFALRLLFSGFRCNVILVEVYPENEADSSSEMSLTTSVLFSIRAQKITSKPLMP
jgi:hypothetical protein